MSIKTVKTFALDFTRDAPLEYIFVKAGDKDSRVLDITPLNSGLAYELPEGVKVIFAAKKPDKTEILNDATVNADTGHIEVVLSEQTLASEGIIVCEVGLFSSEGEFISSQHFYMKASPFALTDVKSKNEYNSLVVALLSVDEKVREAEKAIKRINDAVENGDVGSGTGVSITDTTINTEGELEIAFSDGNIKNVGKVTGEKGNSGVWIGPEPPPEGEGYNVWIDTSDDANVLLKTPAITISDSTLRVSGMTAGISKTVLFYKDGAIFTGVSGITEDSMVYDLSGMAYAFRTGTYSITVKCTASGFYDSEFSNAVNYTVNYSL